jgi:hypothetical protein
MKDTLMNINQPASQLSSASDSALLARADAIHSAMADNPSHANPLPPLVCFSKGGHRYARPPHINAEIRRLLPLARSHWVAQAGSLQNETLVYLIRLTHENDSTVCGNLMLELQKRITRQARVFCRDMDDFDEEQFISDVEIRVLELVLTKEQSRKRDVLEVAFGQAVKRLALDELKTFENSTAAHIADFAVATDVHWDGEEEIERPIEFLPDATSGPEDILLNLDKGKHGHRLLRKALQAVSDPRHREAAILHWGRGIPIESCRRGKDCLTRRFRKDARQIKYWLDVAMKQMRDALGLTVGAVSDRPHFVASRNTSNLETLNRAVGDRPYS